MPDNDIPTSPPVIRRVTRRSFLRATGTTGMLAVGLPSLHADVRAQVDDYDIPATLPTALQINREAGTATLPLYRGIGPDGSNVYHIVTETSRFDEAVRSGVNWAPKLRNALGTPAVQQVTGQLQSPRSRTQSAVTFDATVDFSQNTETPDGGIPVGQEGYSPLFTTQDRGQTSGVVYNAPHVENASGRHPNVIRVDRDDMRVTLDLTAGFHDSYRVLAFCSDASTQSTAARTGATFAPTLADAPAPGDRDLSSSAREAVITIVNGPTGQRNLQRQGIESALAGEGDSLDVFRSSQVCRDATDPTDCSVFYSPIWDVSRMVWTDAAIETGTRRRLTSHEAVVDRFLAGDLQSATPDGPANPLLANVPASGDAVDAPLVDIQRTGDG